MTVISGSAQACSFGPNHLRNSNYEMVKDAELIILAEAEFVAPLQKNNNPEDTSIRPQIRFSIDSHKCLGDQLFPALHRHHSGKGKQIPET